MLLPTLLASLLLLPFLFVSSDAKHDSLRPLHRSGSTSSPRLVVRQDEESTCPDCLTITDIGEVCLAALPAGTLETEDGLPPRNDCFCTQELFDLSDSCGACLKTEGSVQAGTDYLVEFDAFRSACISAGFAITPSTQSEETEVVASTTSSGIEDASSATEEAINTSGAASTQAISPSTTAAVQKTSATSKAAQSSASKSAVPSASSTGGAQGRAMVHGGLVGVMGLVFAGLAL
ncbi:hypothetical protein BDY24DRAFT_413448 [Mrakia frigida]|uniref:uncharacterized protein n=1 Tax=Mrakia frigida TaxID=29902 RepID=UPI003FCC268A